MRRRCVCRCGQKDADGKQRTTHFFRWILILAPIARPTTSTHREYSEVAAIMTECGTQTQIVSRLQTGARAVPTLRVKVDRYYPRNQLLNETLAHRTAKASPRSPHHAPCTKICGEQWLSGFWNPSPTHEQPQVAPHPTSSCAAKNEPAYIRSKESVYLPARNAPRTEEHTGRHTPDPSAVLIKRHPDCSGYPQRHSSSREENRSGRCSVAPERRAAHWPLLDQLEKAAV